MIATLTQWLFQVLLKEFPDCRCSKVFHSCLYPEYLGRVDILHHTFEAVEVTRLNQGLNSLYFIGEAFDDQNFIDNAIGGGKKART